MPEGKKKLKNASLTTLMSKVFKNISKNVISYSMIAMFVALAFLLFRRKGNDKKKDEENEKKVCAEPLKKVAQQVCEEQKEEEKKGINLLEHFDLEDIDVGDLTSELSGTETESDFQFIDLTKDLNLNLPAKVLNKLREWLMFGKIPTDKQIVTEFGEELDIEKTRQYISNYKNKLQHVESSARSLLNKSEYNHADGMPDGRQRRNLSDMAVEQEGEKIHLQNVKKQKRRINSMPVKHMKSRAFSRRIEVVSSNIRFKDYKAALQHLNKANMGTGRRDSAEKSTIRRTSLTKADLVPDKPPNVAPQPKKFPRNVENLKIYFWDIDLKKWWSGKISEYIARKDNAEVEALELWEGCKWTQTIKLKKKWEKHLVYFMKDLTKNEKKEKHIQELFYIIDEDENGELDSYEFQTGLEKLNFNYTHEQFLDIFYKIDEESENYIDSSLLIEFVLSKHEEPLFNDFVIQLLNTPIPIKPLVSCFVCGLERLFEDRALKCTDCEEFICKRCSCTRPKLEKIEFEIDKKNIIAQNSYCQRCFDKHLCQECNTWILEPVNLEMHTFCQRCYGYKYEHETTIKITRYPIGFTLKDGDKLPYCYNIQKKLQIHDIVEGSRIIKIDGKNVENWTAKK